MSWYLAKEMNRVIIKSPKSYHWQQDYWGLLYNALQNMIGIWDHSKQKWHKI